MRNFQKPDEVSAMLNMLERLEEAQQNEILEHLTSTDPAKAALVKVRLLSVEKVLALDTESLSRILEDLPVDVVASVIINIDPELRKRTLDHLNSSTKQSVLKRIKTISQDVELLKTSKIEFYKRVRLLEKRGSIHLGAMVSKKAA